MRGKERAKKSVFQAYIACSFFMKKAYDYKHIYTSIRYGCRKRFKSKNKNVIKIMNLMYNLCVYMDRFTINKIIRNRGEMLWIQF